MPVCPFPTYRAEFGRSRSNHLDWVSRNLGALKPHKTRPFLRCVTVPNLVVLGQTVERTYGNTPVKLGTSRPAFQGRSKSSELTWIDRLPMNLLSVIRGNHGPFSYSFRDFVS